MFRQAGTLGQHCMSIYQRRSAFCDLDQSIPILLFQKPWRFNDNFLTEWCSATLRLCNYEKADAKIQGMILCQSHRHLSGHSVPYHTGFLFQNHIQVTNPCFSKKTNKQKTFNHWVDIWTRSKTTQCWQWPSKVKWCHGIHFVSCITRLHSRNWNKSSSSLPQYVPNMNKKPSADFLFCLCVCEMYQHTWWDLVIMLFNKTIKLVFKCANGHLRLLCIFPFLCFPILCFTQS